MQETKNVEEMSIEEQFLFCQETFEEASARAIEESKSFSKTEYFKMDKFGTYVLRIAPLAPNRDKDQPQRKSYEYPCHQMLLEINTPKKTNGKSIIYAKVPRTTEAGFSLDLIDTYRSLAIAEAKMNNDEDLEKKIGGGKFGGGLKFNYGHSMYVLDLDDRAKGFQLLTLSHSQFKELDDAKLKLWKKKCTKNPNHRCVVSSIDNAYPVEIEKKKSEGNKTDYVINIDNESDYDLFSKEELQTLLNLPRIPEINNRFTRYSLGAEIEFLKQYDEKCGFKIMETEEMKDAIKKISSELPKEDTTEFSFDRNSAAGSTETAKEKGIEELWDMFDKLEEAGLGDKTEEGQNLRGLIRELIEREGIDIRFSRTASNQDVLKMIEEYYTSTAKNSVAEGEDDPEEEEKKPEPEPEPETKPASKDPIDARASRAGSRRRG